MTNLGQDLLKAVKWLEKFRHCFMNNEWHILKGFDNPCAVYWDFDRQLSAAAQYWKRWYTDCEEYSSQHFLFKIPSYIWEFKVLFA